MKTEGQSTAKALQRAWQTGLLDRTNDPAALFVDWDVLDHRLHCLRQEWPQMEHAVAIKSQPHPGVLRYLVQQGFGLEAASLEEVKRGLEAGCAPHKIVFDSPVKTREELNWLQQHTPGLLVNANALEELPRHPQMLNYRLGLRINPEVHTGSPALFHVSSNASKFGVSITQRAQILDALRTYPISGLHLHSGSQITDLPAQIRAIRLVLELAQEANAERQKLGLALLDWIDIGGGLPASPWDGMRRYAHEFFQNTTPEERSQFTWHTEFGQWVHAHAGWTVSRLEYVLPRTDAASVAYLHVGADLFLRDAYTAPRPFPLLALNADGTPNTNTRLQPYDVAGPLCFAGDYLARNAPLPELHEGDWLVVQETGANAYGLWSRHCSRTIPAVLGHRPSTGELQKLSDRTEINF